MPNFSSFLSTALDAVDQAERIILPYLEGRVASIRKPDNTPVTEADRQAEAVIKQVISTQFPEHGFLGEETGSSTKSSEYTWIIDPIDGTKNFTRHLPTFATQLALMKGSEIILGVSNAPLFHERVWAVRGSGAFFGDERLAVSKISEIGDAFVSYGSIGSFNKIGKLAPLLSLEGDALGHRSYGDFWAYHLLAMGKIDIVVEAKIKIWDVAAVSLIVEEAGGVVTDIDGAKITRDTTTILATNGLLHDKVLAYFEEK